MRGVRLSRKAGLRFSHRLRHADGFEIQSWQMKPPSPFFPPFFLCPKRAHSMGLRNRRNHRAIVRGGVVSQSLRSPPPFLGRIRLKLSELLFLSPSRCKALVKGVDGLGELTGVKVLFSVL